MCFRADVRERNVAMAGRRGIAGFTLAEVLVVVAIIGALLALLVPVVQQARETGRRNTCIHNLRQVSLAMRRYDQINEFLPGWRNRIEVSSISASPPPNFPSWPVMLLPHLDETDVFTTWTSGTTPNAPYIPVFVCPSSGGGSTTVPVLSYAGNAGSANSGSRSLRASGVLVDNTFVDPATSSKVRVSLDEVAADDGGETTLLLAEKSIAPGSTGFSQGSWSVVLPTVSGSFTFGTDPVPAFGIVADPPAEVINSSSLGPPGLVNQPSSNHPGGAVVSFCGDRVTFLSNSLAPQVYAQLLSSKHSLASGTTPYSTWCPANTPPPSADDYR